MRAVVQRVIRAAVTLQETGERREIGSGLVVLIAVGHEDNQTDVEYIADKIVGLRIFSDNEGKMNRSLIDNPDYGILVISQFTLLGDTKKGRRPSYIAAAHPSRAIPLYENFIDIIGRSVGTVQTGEFGADMLVEIHNDGPVTLIVDSPATRSI